MHFSFFFVGVALGPLGFSLFLSITGIILKADDSATAGRNTYLITISLVGGGEDWLRKKRTYIVQ